MRFLSHRYPAVPDSCSRSSRNFLRLWPKMAGCGALICLPLLSQIVPTGPFTYSGLTPLSGTMYFSPGGGALPTGDLTIAGTPSPYTAIIGNFIVKISVAPGAGNSVTFTWLNNGTVEPVTCTITGASTTCMDFTHTFTTNQADTTVIRSTVSGSITGVVRLAMLSQIGQAALVPPGLIAISLTACPASYTEVTALNGVTLIGTLFANGDVGTTGGSNTITPTGTVGAPVFTGSLDTTSATSAGTPAGTVAAPIFTGATLSAHAHELPFILDTASPRLHQIAPTIFGTGTVRSATSQSAQAVSTTVAAVALSQSVSAGTPTGTNSAPAFTGVALGSHTHTVTPTGTVSAPAFTGASFDNRSAYVKVIFCSKN
jgi:hypothetical protein